MPTPPFVPWDWWKRLADTKPMSLPGLVQRVTGELFPEDAPPTNLTAMGEEQYSGRPFAALLDALAYGPGAVSPSFKKDVDVVSQLPIMGQARWRDKSVPRELIQLLREGTRHPLEAKVNARNTSYHATHPAAAESILRTGAITPSGNVAAATMSPTHAAAKEKMVYEVYNALTHNDITPANMEKFIKTFYSPDPDIMTLLKKKHKGDPNAYTESLLDVFDEIVGAMDQNSLAQFQSDIESTLGIKLTTPIGKSQTKGLKTYKYDQLLSNKDLAHAKESVVQGLKIFHPDSDAVLDVKHFLKTSLGIPPEVDLPNNLVPQMLDKYGAKFKSAGAWQDMHDIMGVATDKYDVAPFDWKRSSDSYWGSGATSGTHNTAPGVAFARTFKGKTKGSNPIVFVVDNEKAPKTFPITAEGYRKTNPVPVNPSFENTPKWIVENYGSLEDKKNFKLIQEKINTFSDNRGLFHKDVNPQLNKLRVEEEALAAKIKLNTHHNMNLAFENESRTKNKAVPVNAVKEILVDKSGLGRSYLSKDLTPLLQEATKRNIPVREVPDFNSLKLNRLRDYLREDMKPKEVVTPPPIDTKIAGKNQKDLQNLYKQQASLDMDSPTYWVLQEKIDALKGFEPIHIDLKKLANIKNKKPLPWEEDTLLDEFIQNEKPWLDAADEVDFNPEVTFEDVLNPMDDELKKLGLIKTFEPHANMIEKLKHLFDKKP
jgi:hypothetical protein